MGFNNQTVSYVTYRVTEDVNGEELRQSILRGLTVGRISPIDVDLGHDQSFGFATFEDPLQTEFTEQNIFFDPLAVFSFRVDKLAVPAGTLRIYTRKRLQDRLAASSRSRMPREERDELSEQVRLELLRRALPSINAVDVIWDMARGIIRFYSLSQSLNEAFLVRFNQFLDLKLQAMNPVGILESRLDEREIEQVWHLLPTSFLFGGTIEPGTATFDPEPCADDEGETENA